MTLILLSLACVTNATAFESIKVVTEDWPPYNFSMPNGKVGGISTKIVRAVLDKTDLKYDIQVYPWARSFDMAQTQPNVLIYSIFRSREREHLFKWICPLTPPVKLYLYRLTEKHSLNVENIMDAKKYSTGVTRGDYPHHYLMNLGFTEAAHLQLSPNDDLNVRKLLNGRIDFVIEAQMTIRSILNKDHIAYAKVTPVLEITRRNAAPNCMAFGKQTADSLVQKVRKALHEFNAQQIY
ncbi:MAG: transporter substrate-binding domain-containing protein [Algicola sp.]|nr:transporter substrate-binding domain-containing protein [Algicola sp.]